MHVLISRRIKSDNEGEEGEQADAMQQDGPGGDDFDDLMFDERFTQVQCYFKEGETHAARCIASTHNLPPIRTETPSLHKSSNGIKILSVCVHAHMTTR